MLSFWDSDQFEPMKKLITTSLLLVVLTGCATALTERAQSIQVVDGTQIEGCTHLGAVNGWSPIGECCEAGITDAENKALNLAAHRGATHLVWTGISRASQTTVVAHIYKCP